MALEVTFKSERKGYYESQVRHILKVLVTPNPMGEKSIYDAKRIFDFDLSMIPKKSTGTAELFYKAVIVANKQLEVYHLNAVGDIDRVIAVVNEVN